MPPPRRRPPALACARTRIFSATGLAPACRDHKLPHDIRPFVGNVLGQEPSVRIPFYVDRADAERFDELDHKLRLGLTRVVLWSSRLRVPEPDDVQSDRVEVLAQPADDIAVGRLTGTPWQSTVHQDEGLAFPRLDIVRFHAVDIDPVVRVVLLLSQP